MLSWIVVVDDHLYDLVVTEDETVCVFSIDGGVGGHFSSCHDSVQGWYLGSYVGYIVEERVILSQLSVSTRQARRYVRLQLRYRGCPSLHRL